MSTLSFTSGVPYVGGVPTTRIPRSEWPTTSYRPFFLYDRDHPTSLYASVIDAWDGGTTDGGSAYTYLVDCPSTKCSTDFSPQTIYHIDGSIWAGQRVVDRTTTTWVCNLATMGYRRSLPYSAHCTSTEGRDLDVKLPLTPTEANMGECSVEARSVIVQITAGMDKIYENEAYWPPDLDVDGLGSAISHNADLVCPTSWRDIATNEATTTQESSAVETSSSSSTGDAGGTGTNEDTGAAGGTGTGEASPTETDDSSRVSLGISLVVGLAMSACLVNAF